ncbi:MAG: glycosyltransferase family 2 protein [Planctomycetota bacterium]
MGAVASLDLSVVVPLHDEEESVPRLQPRIEAACAGLGRSFEIILVDDGSTDRTWDRMNELTCSAGELVLVALRRNCGQTPAMAAGFALARGEVVVAMDGDLQNDPADIPALLDECAKGYDLVCGWRRNRQDKLWTRKIPSRCANWLIRKVTGVHIHDYGCSLKAYRGDLVRNLRLYSDMHRFLPFVAQKIGARVTEIVVRHHPRRYGRTKYGLSRTWKVLVDLVSFKMLVHHHRRIFRWFCLLALPVLLVAAGAFLGTLFADPPGRNVLFGCGLVLGTLGLFIVFLGLVGDLVVAGDPAEYEELRLLEPRRWSTVS